MPAFLLSPLFRKVAAGAVIVIALLYAWSNLKDSQARATAAEALLVDSQAQLTSMTEGNQTLRTAILNKDKEITELRSEIQRTTRDTEVVEEYDPATGNLVRRTTRTKEEIFKELMAQINRLEKTPDIALPTPERAPAARKSDRAFRFGLVGYVNQDMEWAVGPSWEIVELTLPLFPSARLSIAPAVAGDRDGKFRVAAMATVRFGRR